MWSWYHAISFWQHLCSPIPCNFARYQIPSLWVWGVISLHLLHSKRILSVHFAPIKGAVTLLESNSCHKSTNSWNSRIFNGKTFCHLLESSSDIMIILFSCIAQCRISHKIFKRLFYFLVLVGCDCNEFCRFEGECLEIAPRQPRYVTCFHNMNSRLVFVHGIQDRLQKIKII